MNAGRGAPVHARQSGVAGQASGVAKSGVANNPNNPNKFNNPNNFNNPNRCSWTMRNTIRCARRDVMYWSF